MPAKLSTTVGKIKLLSSQENANLITKFHEFMKYNGVSERHQNNNLKAIISYSNFLDNDQLKTSAKKKMFCPTFKLKSRLRKTILTKNGSLPTTITFTE